MAGRVPLGGCARFRRRVETLDRTHTHEDKYSEEQELGNDERRLRPGGGQRVQRWEFLKCLGD